MRWLRTVLLCSLSACMVRYDNPNDVHLVGLKLGEGPYYNSKYEKRGKGEMIDIEVITMTNYTTRFRGYYVDVSFYFCDQASTYVQGLGGLSLYRYDGEWISIDGDKGDDISPGPYYYHTAMSSFAHDKTPFSNEPTILDYDLRETPRDVCFYLDARALNLPGSTRSNVVRIPKEVLTKFFAEHPRRPLSPN